MGIPHIGALGKFPPMDKAEMEEAIQFVIEGTQKMLAEGDMESLPATVYAFQWGAGSDDPDGKLIKTCDIIVLADFPFDTRHEILFAVGHRLGAERAMLRGVVLVNETWTSVPDAEGKRRFQNLEDDPERREAITILGMTFHKDFLGSIMRITRNDANKMVAGEVHEVKVAKNLLCQSILNGYAAAAVMELMKSVVMEDE